MEKGISTTSKRIAVLGPESSGKTTLCTSFEEEHGAQVVWEYAREYLECRDRPYGIEDLVLMAEEQFQRNQQSTDGLLVCDTEMITMAIWCKEKFGQLHDRIDSLLSAQDFDFYLLCKPDFPWEPDPFRENPADRDRLFELYRKELEEQDVDFIVLEGSHASRIKLVESVLSLPR